MPSQDALERQVLDKSPDNNTWFCAHVKNNLPPIYVSWLNTVTALVESTSGHLGTAKYREFWDGYTTRLYSY